MTSDSYLTGGNRPFYLHYEFEHEGLDCAVHDLQRCLQDPKKPIAKDQLTRRLSQLRSLMTKHFREEEEGCFDEICAQHPHMCPATRQMEQTHQMLLSQLDALVRELEAHLVTKDWVEGFDAFADEMNKHKEEEQAFVRRGLYLPDDEA